MTFEELIKPILKFEGGYVNHPMDRGGPTNRGITLATYARWRKKEPHEVTYNQIEAITEQDAIEIYKYEYYHKHHIDLLPIQLQPFALNMVIMSGPSAPLKNLQKLVGAETDGVIGPNTRAAIEIHGHIRELLNQWVSIEIIRLLRLAKNNPSQVVFVEGWFRRLSSFYNFAY